MTEKSDEDYIIEALALPATKGWQGVKEGKPFTDAWFADLEEEHIKKFVDESKVSALLSSASDDESLPATKERLVAYYRALLSDIVQYCQVHEERMSEDYHDSVLQEIATDISLAVARVIPDLSYGQLVRRLIETFDPEIEFTAVSNDCEVLPSEVLENIIETTAFLAGNALTKQYGWNSQREDDFTNLLEVRLRSWLPKQE